MLIGCCTSKYGIDSGVVPPVPRPAVAGGMTAAALLPPEKEAEEDEAAIRAFPEISKLSNTHVPRSKAAKAWSDRR